MPQLKQPMTLKDKCLQECVNLYCSVCVSWISKLRQAEESSIKDYWVTEKCILAECRLIQRSLSEVPYFIREMMSPELTRKFANIIYAYIDKTSQLTNGFVDEESNNSLYIAMFRSVLTPRVYKYNDEIMSNSFTRYLVLQTLDSVPGLRTLHLPRLFKYVGDRRVPTRMIYYLRHLQIFTYEVCCTDEVIEQLGLHCTYLKKVSVCRSIRVTNACAKHLMRLKKLEFLNLSGTTIDKEHYAWVLSVLPQIKDIVFRRYDDDILDHVAEKNLHKISHVSGYVEDISKLAHRCRNITNLDIYFLTKDLSGLAALTTLHTLRLIPEYYAEYNPNPVLIDLQHYAEYNLNPVLTDIGHRLTDLNLDSIGHVNLQDIVTLCPSLVSLTLRWCTLSLDPDTQLDPQLPHFRNLISLHITESLRHKWSCDYIRHYVSLKTIRLYYISIFTVEFMREVVRSGTLADLEDIAVYEINPNAMTTEALELLIKHCSHLKRIRGLKTCGQIPSSFIGELKSRLLMQNFDLEFTYC